MLHNAGINLETGDPGPSQREQAHVGRRKQLIWLVALVRSFYSRSRVVLLELWTQLRALILFWSISTTACAISMNGSRSSRLRPGSMLWAKARIPEEIDLGQWVRNKLDGVHHLLMKSVRSDTVSGSARSGIDATEKHAASRSGFT
jgi:hypothetical protein